MARGLEGDAKGRAARARAAGEESHIQAYTEMNSAAVEAAESPCTE